MAHSTGSPANARAVTSNGEPGSPSSTKSPFLVPTTSSVMSRSSSRDRRQDVDSVVRADLRVLLAELAVDKDVDMPPQRPALVEDPALQGGVRPLEPGQRRPNRHPLDRMLGAIPRQPFEGLPETDARHAPDPRRAGSRCPAPRARPRRRPSGSRRARGPRAPARP